MANHTSELTASLQQSGRRDLEKLGLKELMLWTNNKITASNCKNNMEGYTYNIQHLTLPKGCINEQGNKRNLKTISQGKNIFIPD